MPVRTLWVDRLCRSPAIQTHSKTRFETQSIARTYCFSCPIAYIQANAR